MLAKMSVQKPYTVAVGVLLVLVLGVISFMNMTTDLLPNMNLPYIVVVTSYVGASPEAVETNVTKPLETSISSVSNLKSISSVSKENLSTITLEFNDGASMDTAMLELNAKIDLVKPKFPDKVGTPTLVKVNPDLLPVVVASVDYQGKDMIELSDYVDNVLMPQLEGIDGVATVTANGLVEEKVTVSIDQAHIDQLNSIILKELDKELYKVEQKLNDGEKALQEAKKKLSTEGKDGLRQLDEALDKLRETRANVAGVVQKLSDQQADLMEKRASAQAGQTKLEQAIAQIPEKMGDDEAHALAQLETKLAAEQSALTEARSALAEVERRLRAIEAGEPEETPAPTPTPTINPDDKSQNLRKAVGGKKIKEADETGEKSSITDQSLKKQTEVLEHMAEWLMPSAHAQSVDERKAYLLAEKARLEALAAQYEAQINAITQSATYRQLRALADAVAQRAGLAAQLADLKANLAELDAGIEKLDVMMQKLNRGVIPGGLMTGIDQDTTFDEAEKNLIATRAKAEKGLSDGAKKIRDAEKKLGEARKEFEEKREDAFKKAKLDGVITVQMISQIIGAQNLSMPAGYLTEAGQDYLVRVGDEFRDVDELNDTLLFTMDLKTLKEVRLRDVAIVSITNNAQDVYAKVNGNDGVLLSFQKQSTFSTAEVAHNITHQFKALSAETPELRLTPLVDQGIYIDMIVDSVLQNLMWGALLAVAMLLLFLFDYRPTLVIAISIPVSVVAAFVTMYFTGITLNVMSLAGLALGVGMLVDNSIVVIENIYRLRGEGVPVLRACVEGTSKVAGAIFSSTLTTVCVFLPFVFITGMAKELFSDMGLTITYSLMASLLVAMTVVPAMCTVILKKRQKPRKTPVYSFIQRVYVACLRFTLRFKLPVLLLAIVLLALSTLRVARMGVSFIPDVDSTQMTATMTPPLTATDEERNALSSQVLEKIMTVPDIDTVGVFNTKNAAMKLVSQNGGVTFYITLKEDKALRNTEIARQIQDAVAPLDCELTVKVSTMDITTLSGEGIKVNIIGPELPELRRIAVDMADKLKAIPGTTNVSDGQDETVPELTLTVDKEKAVENGLTVAQIYQFVYQLVMDGVDVSTITTGGKQYTVMAVDGKNLGMTREELADRTIEVKKADETINVRLGDVCDITETESLSAINRVNQRHMIAVSCLVDADHNIGLVGREVSAMLAGYALPQGYSAEISGESDTIYQTINDLINMILLAIVLIFLIMAAQFQSFLMPFIVLFTIPLAITGGLLGLQIANMDVSMVAMLGMLILAGVIVNNGIVFVDSVNQMRLEGMEKREALLATGRERLRPILMTALTTILGMSTMATATGMGAEMMQPMAVVTIGGLSYGTLLTLFVVPVLYDLMTKKTIKNRLIDESEPDETDASDDVDAETLALVQALEDDTPDYFETEDSLTPGYAVDDLDDTPPVSER